MGRDGEKGRGCERIPHDEFRGLKIAGGEVRRLGKGGSLK